MKTPTQTKLDECLETIDKALAESARVQARALLWLPPEMPASSAGLLEAAKRGDLRKEG